MTATKRGMLQMREDDVVAAIGRLAGSGATRVILGIGDDAAVWQPSRSHRSLITSDALIEGVHFTRQIAIRDIGFRAMAANVSDLAAMGARPVLATIALGIPAAFDLPEIEELYRGLVACANDARMAIVGGDLTRAPVLTIAISAVGEASPTRIKTRAGARRGDVIAATGDLGDSRAGLDLLRMPGVLDEPVAQRARAAFARPAPRWREGLFLAASRNVHAMMDVSDGLATDLARMCAASGLAGRIDAVPAGDAARAMAAHLGEDPERYALAGGEDFELIVAIAPRAFGHLAERFQKRFKRALAPMGVLRDGDGLFWRKSSGEEAVRATGWDHFA